MWLPPDNQRPHRKWRQAHVENGRESPAHRGQTRACRMRDPTKVTRFFDPKTDLTKRPRILFQSRNIHFVARLEDISEVASKQWKVSVHIDHDRVPSRTEEVEDVSGALGFLFQAMTVARRIDAHDQVKGIAQLFVR